MSLRFFADHCVPAVVTRLLRDDNHEVLVIKEHIPPDSKDQTVIAKAQDLNAILVSLNGDFSDIVTYPPAAYRGIVSLQVRNHPEAIPALMNRLLAPAFDMNPSIDKREHVLTIDGLSADPDIELALATCGFYGLDDGRANEIVDTTRAIVSTWKQRARKMRIAASDIELTASAFSALDDGGRR